MKNFKGAELGRVGTDLAAVRSGRENLGGRVGAAGKLQVCGAGWGGRDGGTEDRAGNLGEPETCTQSPVSGVSNKWEVTVGGVSESPYVTYVSLMYLA